MVTLEKTKWSDDIEYANCAKMPIDDLLKDLTKLKSDGHVFINIETDEGSVATVYGWHDVKMSDKEVLSKANGIKGNLEQNIKMRKKEIEGMENELKDLNETFFNN